MFIGETINSVLSRHVGGMLHSKIKRIETHHSGTLRKKPVMRTILDKVHKIRWFVHCKTKRNVVSGAKDYMSISNCTNNVKLGNFSELG